MLGGLVSLWPNAVGYLIAIFLAQRFIWPTVNSMWLNLGVSRKNRPRHWQAVILGSTERALFVASFQLGKPEFIGIWLALKVAGQWKNWSDDWSIEVRGGQTVSIVGREVFNIFLLGNALSVGFAALGAKSIEWLSSGVFYKAIAANVAATVGATIVWLIARSKQDHASSTGLQRIQKTGNVNPTLLAKPDEPLKVEKESLPMNVER